MRDSITVKVPATTANMGPGFDCLGMALDIWNTVSAEVGPSRFEIVGHGAESLPRGEGNLIYESFCIPFSETGQPVPSVGITCWNEVPLGRGLGSSSAAMVAGLVAGNELCGRPLAMERILGIAADLEGHPDNVAPALLGGFQIGAKVDDRLITARVPIPPDLRAVVFIPDMPMSTEEARELLPLNVPREDAVYNMSRVALLVRAFCTGDLTHLAAASDDRLHQPAREKMFPRMKNLFRAARDAGALGVFLSGGGSSVLALTQGREFTIGYEMADAADKSGISGTFKVTRPTEEGVHTVSGD